MFLLSFSLRIEVQISPVVIAQQLRVIAGPSSKYSFSIFPKVLMSLQVDKSGKVI